MFTRGREGMDLVVRHRDVHERADGCEFDTCAFEMFTKGRKGGIWWCAFEMFTRGRKGVNLVVRLRDVHERAEGWNLVVRHCDVHERAGRCEFGGAPLRCSREGERVRIWWCAFEMFTRGRERIPLM